MRPELPLGDLDESCFDWDVGRLYRVYTSLPATPRHDTTPVVNFPRRNFVNRHRHRRGRAYVCCSAACAGS